MPLRPLLELIRFSHTVFALPFALCAAVLAWHLTWREARQVEQLRDSIRQSQLAVAAVRGAVGSDSAAEMPLLALNARNEIPSGEPEPAVVFRWRDLAAIVLCMVCARSAAMAFNRLVDRRIDAANPRTEMRHLPAGILSVGSVALFTLVSGAGFIAATALFLPNRLPLELSVPVLLFLLGYSFAKRFTWLAHFWLGAALMLAPISAWIALRGAIVQVEWRDLLPAVYLGGAVFFWVAGFDIIYACQDAEFDREHRLRSVPARFGIMRALDIAASCHFLALVLLAALPFQYHELGLIYWLGIAAVGILLTYEHAIVRPHDLSRLNRAFFHVNAVISLGVFAVTCLDLLLNSAS
ncbi:MAG TPA: UbiA-like polyprenyltransferase [Pirellulales bacterium]|jgi:4-hydroxybenzoate polyprenyltransferase|nr:UbiA-like polyprenyltransferase [Pirellulales bacterium]